MPLKTRSLKAFLFVVGLNRHHLNYTLAGIDSLRQQLRLFTPLLANRQCFGTIKISVYSFCLFKVYNFLQLLLRGQAYFLN